MLHLLLIFALPGILLPAPWGCRKLDRFDSLAPGGAESLSAGRRTAVEGPRITSRWVLWFCGLSQLAGELLLHFQPRAPLPLLTHFPSLQTHTKPKGKDTNLARGMEESKLMTLHDKKTKCVLSNTDNMAAVGEEFGSRDPGA